MSKSDELSDAERRERAVKEIGRLLDIGIASGPSLDGPKPMKKLRRVLEAEIFRRHKPDPDG